ncbi:hypothetical protein ABIC75_000817 [Dyella japonica]|uniref:Uncharacterized protein n=1 Tax=Dyella japonica TaxID=231455 RepID=A0ABV2JS62_9GAMM
MASAARRHAKRTAEADQLTDKTIGGGRPEGVHA